MIKITKAKIETLQKTIAELTSHSFNFAGSCSLINSIEPHAGGHFHLMKFAHHDAENTKGETSNKGKSFDAVKKCGSKLTPKASVWAEENRKADLLPLFNQGVSDLPSIGPLKAMNLATTPAEKLRENLVGLAGERIATTIPDAFLVKSDAHKSSNPSPQLKWDPGAANIADLLAQLNTQDQVQSNIKKRIVSVSGDSHPQIVSCFMASCRIDDPTQRKTLVQITVSEAGSDAKIQGALCGVEELANDDQQTDQLREIKIPGIRHWTKTIGLQKLVYKDRSQVLPLTRV